MKYEELMNMISTIENLDDIKLSEIPDIDLYMDQVTTFMEDKLKDHKRTDEDKIITKTMINNYTKNQLLPRPIKKKYSKDHLILLIILYYMKNVISLTDIEDIFSLIQLDDTKNNSLDTIYENFLNIKEKETKQFSNNIKAELNKLENDFNKDIDNKTLLNLLNSLLIQSYLQKTCAEKIIDYLTNNNKKAD